MLELKLAKRKSPIRFMSLDYEHAVMLNKPTISIHSMIDPVLVGPHKMPFEPNKEAVAAESRTGKLLLKVLPGEQTRFQDLSFSIFKNDEHQMWLEAGQ